MTVAAFWTEILADDPILGKRPDFRFDPDFYIGTSSYSQDSGLAPLDHFLSIGLANGEFGTNYWKIRESIPSLDETVLSLITEPKLRQAILSSLPGACELAFELMLLGTPIDESISDFSAAHYCHIYPEVAKARIAPLLHFLRFGIGEGRRTLRDVRRGQILGARPFDPSLSTCLICVHEFSRTGAPVVGLSLVKAAAISHNVLVASLRGGALNEHFREFAVMLFSSEQPFEDFGYFQSLELDKIDFAILNSVECLAFVPPLVSRKIPFANYIHEYAEYTLPSHKTLFTALFSDLLVFSSEHVRDSWQHIFVDIDFNKQRDSVVIAQESLLVGHVDATSRASSLQKISDLIGRDCCGTKIVFGAGSAHWRKGTDLFVMTAQMARVRGDSAIFIWIGDGFNHEDFSFGVWMDKHIRESNANAPDSNLFFLPSGPYYQDLCRAADVMFLSSRLDPLPNVVFDAVRHGNHVVLFDNATGFCDETYDRHTALTKVPYCDLSAACDALIGAPLKVIDENAEDHLMPLQSKSLFDQISSALKLRLARQRFFAIGAGCYDVPIVAGSGPEKRSERQTEREKLWSYQRRFVWQSPERTQRTLAQSDHFVHQQIGISPYSADQPAHANAVSLHMHVYYVEDLHLVLPKYCAFRNVRRLVLTTDSDQKAARIAHLLQDHQLEAEILVVDNVGRDILPFMRLFDTGGAAADADPDDVWGHVHLKKSLSWSSTGDIWRTFLMDILLGDADEISNAFQHATSPEIGLVGAFDPYIFGWGGSHRVLPQFASRLPLAAPDHPLVFPVGNMFFTRAAVVREMSSLFGKSYPWPNEPLPNDGTVFHMIERLWPLMAAALGFRSEFLDKPEQART